MTNTEFSDQFDILYNNIMSNQAPGLDLYEKSVFLTKAQDEIVKAYFDPRGNKSLSGFDDNERRQIDFSMILRTVTISTFGYSIFDGRPSGVKSITLPSDIYMIVNEKLLVNRSDIGNVRLSVIPLTYTEYTRLMSKPYKRPLKFQAWRVLDNISAGDKHADIISNPNDSIIQYTVRYVKKPRAIILDALSGVTIEGSSTAQTCELDPILHEEILQRAVELAKAAYTGELQAQISLGQVSETNMGIVPQARG